VLLLGALLAPGALSLFAGGRKAIYDLALWTLFRRVRLSHACAVFLGAVLSLLA
jgi:hypothetical protein